MQRNALAKLLEWKNSPRRKPLVVRGVRQCGKTWLLEHFGKTHYATTASFNFETQPRLHSMFAGELDIPRILAALGALHGRKLTPGDTLILFDEIQECPAALNSLKYFCEQAPDYHLAAAGSLLGITLAGQRSFPVGKVNFLDLHPLTFGEYLSAVEGELAHYTEALSELAPLPEAIAERLERHFRDYLTLGGMPEVVSAWQTEKDYQSAEEVQHEILQSYELDFAKHAPKADVPKLFLLWKSIPVHLARENGKFVYGEVKPGARARDLEDALRWLQDAGLVNRVNRVVQPQLPPSAYVDAKFFKLYLADTGLLRKMAGVPAAAIITAPDAFGEFKGRLVENYVQQELRATMNAELYYWTSGNLAEVDFLMPWQLAILPIEVKSGLHVRSRSLTVYRQKYQPPLALRFSLRNLQCADGLLNVPLYLVHRLPKLLQLTGLATPTPPRATP